jgi:hypothetical protein
MRIIDFDMQPCRGLLLVPGPWVRDLEEASSIHRMTRDYIVLLVWRTGLDMGYA